MPIAISLSKSSENHWGSLAQWPLRLDLMLIAVSLYTLFCSFGFGLLQSTNSYDGSFFDYFYLIFQVIAPLFTALVTTLNFYLHVSRTMSPPVMISISLLLLAGWGWTVYSWISDVTSDYSYVLKTITTLWRVLGVAKEIGASLIFILYGLYFYFACVATHRSRRKNRTRGRPSSSPQSPSSEHDIEEEMESDQVQECRPTSTSFIGTSILSTGTSLRCTSLTSDRESSKMHPETTSIEVPTVPPPSYRSRGSSRRRLGLESNHSNDDAL